MCGHGGRLELNEVEFAGLFGTTVDEMSKSVRKDIERGDFSYHILDGAERDKVLLDIISIIDSGNLTIAGDKAKWDYGWKEAFRRYSNTGDLDELVPKYIRHGQPFRLFKNLVVSGEPQFELNWLRIFRKWLFRKWLSNVDTVYEFGCGTGYNLFALAEMYPNKILWGMDWVSSTAAIVNKAARENGWNLRGRFFNFFEPDYRFDIEENSAILTMAALEQTGFEYIPFIEYLISKRPKICVHAEPIVEWYNPNNLVDYTGIRFMQKRRYWGGFPDYMYVLRDRGIIEILAEKRVNFGSLFIEGYSQFVWRPV